ncbi:5-oxoprolinase subunit PxpB [Amycolatopsis acidiphila]|uniref:5-oxoprolinase subunit PxpB n=1 Tax=Amycolatopsis acidiphila TaxID=715473 RepID=A0A558A2I4_9PSEU|nr:5-oxoprolinase subunit PxpB [Amycolatopsis acidiphila]TVT18467.1 5-oxoprolinase subunit PxpB [Amycolatopsis acidiphila]UIJ60020.1 5-oxoprolinase subunit PxpB [Amycolatopsis acidiphila]GHG61825.1 allophanate hydrolase [Amycolatopsis acidiphila]
MRWLPYGTDAVLVECESLSEMSAVRTTVIAARLPDVLEVVPGARTVLVVARPGSTALSEAREAVEAADLANPPGADPRAVELAVRYDGEDLQLVAETAGISADEVVELHTGAEYTVAFTGFAPGFAYLTGLPEPLRQSRLDTPRTKVPAGSVGLAGEFTGVYPRSSPGGWRLLGHTETVLFDSRAERPALLAPGDRVRFRRTR